MLRKFGIIVGLGAFVLAALVVGRTPVADAAPAGPLSAEELAARADVMNGRQQAIEHGCGDCHGGWVNPASPEWLGGMTDTVTQVFQIGPFTTYPRNITPDNQTGIGRFTERQIFNALRFGLRPGETPDVTITGTTPGQGNFPASPKYLAPPMPWPAFRHMSDQDLWDIAAYLKRAVRPIVNRVPDSEGPPDFWSSTYTVEAMGAYPAPAFPTGQERQPE
jgi:mono/diheme cytochrome c family protein